MTTTTTMATVMILLVQTNLATSSPVVEVGVHVEGGVYGAVQQALLNRFDVLLRRQRRPALCVVGGTVQRRDRGAVGALVVGGALLRVAGPAGVRHTFRRGDAGGLQERPGPLRQRAARAPQVELLAPQQVPRRQCDVDGPV